MCMTITCHLVAGLLDEIILVPPVPIDHSLYIFTLSKMNREGKMCVWHLQPNWLQAGGH